jgi:glycosyltransferase involved in cell wall biosynthesis
MKILYISTVCSPKVIDYIFSTSLIKPGQAVQKFHRLLIEGFSKHKDLCDVEVFSSLPVTSKSHKKKFWRLKEDCFEGVKFNYVPFVNLLIIKHLFVFVLTFFKVVFWRFSNYKNDKIVLCDILNISIVWASFLACKLTSQKIAVIVTDLPTFVIVNVNEFSILRRFYLNLNSFVLKRFDLYIGLTQQMNEVINPYNKPFMVMEGLVDSKIGDENSIDVKKSTKRVLLYAGGIYEVYGVKNLIEAFIRLDVDDIELHIYGSGDLENKMEEYCLIDQRIKYFGVVKNEVVVCNLRRATLLINPRPSSEEFTKFSFPSKNMEYMVSGTPLLTTNLPGMPTEYVDFVYLFKDETINGMKETLTDILVRPNEELLNFGLKAKDYVLNNKSNVTQAKRVLDFLKMKK